MTCYIHATTKYIEGSENQFEDEMAFDITFHESCAHPEDVQPELHVKETCTSIDPKYLLSGFNGGSIAPINFTGGPLPLGREETFGKP